MNDPWDVKSVRRAGQYVSCMKMNGVPLLPPVLSKECHKEMQYYKLLAKEVEKRISILEPYILNDASDSEDETDAPELPESEQISEPQNQLAAHLNHDTNKIIYNTNNNYESYSPKNITANIYNNTVNSNITVESNDLSIRANSPKLVIDFNFSINENNVINTTYNSPVDLPERDYNCLKKGDTNAIEEDKSHLSGSNKSSQNAPNGPKDKVDVSNHFTDQDGPSSLSSKSFTGSLNDLYTSSRTTGSGPPLIRQSSYTLLKPGPQLQAHLEIQSKSMGLEMNLISMSESVSNLNTPCKKRRSWDLETAKEQWSSMALELRQRNMSDGAKMKRKINIKSASQTSPLRSKSVTATRRNILTPKDTPKSEPVQPINVTPKRPIAKEITPAKNKALNSSHTKVAPLVSEADDPAARVRELYEKIQNQQLIQMASLVEKQKKEQLLLQQVFEEQNNLLYKQLKTICPKSPVEVKEAWIDKNQDVERGPVSLSQLINHKSPDSSTMNSPVSSTLTDTNNYLSHCDDMLKKSRHITERFKSENKSASRNGVTSQPSKPNLEGSITRTHSPSQRSTLASRRLNYDTSASLDHDYDTILTDRTNDTMADLNTTFPSDNSDDYNSVQSKTKPDLLKKIHGNHTNGRNSDVRDMYSRTENSISKADNSIKKVNSSASRIAKPVHNPPSERQRTAATKIVAHAKGFLVRRLMKTERVQATVQTIKDALLCALQLHQDREGIRGADVDLHRRLIQQITAACYSLHDTFITSTPTERCAMIAADRNRRNSIAAKQSPRNFRQTDV